MGQGPVAVSGLQGLPFQSKAWGGIGVSLPPDGVVLQVEGHVGEDGALPGGGQGVGVGFLIGPGATPKKPYSGLMAHRRPSAPTRSQAMSSPTHQHFQPFF